MGVRARDADVVFGGLILLVVLAGVWIVAWVLKDGLATYAAISVSAAGVAMWLGSVVSWVRTAIAIRDEWALMKLDIAEKQRAFDDADAQIKRILDEE
jgi:hypothetical protein